LEQNKTLTSGSLKISEDVISTVAKLTINEINGVHSLAPSSASVMEIVAKTGATKSIKIDLNGDVAQIDISVILKSGHKIKDVAERIQTAVKDAVQNMTGVAVSKVNIYVAGVKFDEQLKQD
jgi:uncharacterized alkaline shock family protein YloU